MDKASSLRFDLCVIVDDDPDILTAGRLQMRKVFEEVVTAECPRAALEALQGRQPDLILLDANFARGATDAKEGLDFLDELMTNDPAAAVVMITAHGGVGIAVEAMKRGAMDFILKPWSNERLLSAARTAAAVRRSKLAMSKAIPVKAAPAAPSNLIWGRSAAMARISSLVSKAAPTNANILLLGENGTGKEVIARELHRQSLRSNGPMISVDMGAIAESLIDSELFGHTKGSFTHASSDRQGRVQAAHGGTLFLDEIGNLPLHLQPKLLTLLEQRCVTPVGSNKPVTVDVRVIAATNLSRQQLEDPKTFRQDLLFRLNTVEIELPPLRQRADDIPLLLEHFVTLYARQYGRTPPRIGDGVVRLLSEHGWPGNVRALRHAVERAVILGGPEELVPQDFNLDTVAAGSPAARAEVKDTVVRESGSGGIQLHDLNLDNAERAILETALRRNGYNISHAAAELGVSRAALYRRMEKHGL